MQYTFLINYAHTAIPTLSIADWLTNTSFVTQLCDNTLAKTSSLKPKDVLVHLTKNDKPVSIYPNPSNQMFHVNLEGYADTKIEVYNMFGQLLSSKNYTQQADIDMQNCNAGMYFIKIYDSNDQLLQTEKLSLVK